MEGRYLRRDDDARKAEEGCRRDWEKRMRKRVLVSFLGIMTAGDDILLPA